MYVCVCLLLFLLIALQMNESAVMEILAGRADKNGRKNSKEQKEVLNFEEFSRMFGDLLG